MKIVQALLVMATAIMSVNVADGAQICPDGTPAPTTPAPTTPAPTTPAPTTPAPTTPVPTTPVPTTPVPTTPAPTASIPTMIVPNCPSVEVGIAYRNPSFINLLNYDLAGCCAVCLATPGCLSFVQANKICVIQYNIRSTDAVLSSNFKSAISPPHYPSANSTQHLRLHPT